MNSKLQEGILFTDQYQLTMAQMYFRNSLHTKKVQFEYFFRHYPDYGAHQCGYCVFAGFGSLMEWMREARFSEEEIGCLTKQKTKTGKPFYDAAFLDWLKEEGNFSKVRIRGIPEGRVIHTNIPVLTIEGPLAMLQVLESPLLNHLNYQTLIATKASRIREAAGENSILEFGLRRAPGWGANAGARAALIGGVDFTSNVGMSHVLGYPPKGTHAHSMVQVFMAMGEGEEGAFRAFAQSYPDDCLFLVDTINTMESGIPNAVKTFKVLKKKGHKPVGIRLDSGDLAYLSIQAAKLLNKEGIEDCSIVLSNQLDELVIWQIVTQILAEANKYGVDPEKLIKRLVYGVGTNLITSKGYGALDGVYKLVAVEENGKLKPTVKFSEVKEKATNPGEKNVWRIYDKRKKAVADVIARADENFERDSEIILHHPVNQGMQRVLDRKDVLEMEPLLKDLYREGKYFDADADIEQMRERRIKDLAALDEGVKRLMNPHIYHVSLSDKLWQLKQSLKPS